MARKLTPAQRRFKVASFKCQAVMKKAILDNPKVRPFKAYGHCMRKQLK